MNFDGKEIYITDDTDYPSGAAYSIYKLYLVATLKNYDQDTPLTVTRLQTGNHSNPSAIIRDKWAVKTVGDGWHEYYMILAQGNPSVIQAAWDSYLASKAFIGKSSFTSNGTTISYQYLRYNSLKYPYFEPKAQKKLETYIKATPIEVPEEKDFWLMRAVQISAAYNFAPGQAFNLDLLRRQSQYIIESYEQHCAQQA